MKKAENNRNQKAMQTMAKKMVILFLIIIFLLTFLSRAADSVTVPRVVTQNPGGGTLTFVAEGTGTVVSGRNRYLKVRQGIGIDKIYVKEGEEVKKEQVLLEYNKEDINTAIKKQQREIEKLKIQIRQEKVSSISTDTGEKKKLSFAYQLAEENLKTAKEEVKEAEKNCGLNLSKSKLKLLEEKYKDYETHQEEVAALERKLERAKEDARILKKIYKETEEEGDTDAAKQAYKEARREEEDAAENLSAAVKQEERILAAAEDYVQAVQSDNTEEVNASLEAVRKGVYGASGYEKQKKDKAAAEIKLQQAKKKETDVADKNALSLKAETEKLILLEQDIKSLNNGTYDFEEEALKLETEIEEAQEKVKTAKAALKEASVNLEADKLDNEAKAEQRNEEKEDALLKQEALQLDLDEKEEEFQKLNDLKENGGLLKSQVSDRVDKISIEAGKTAGIEDTVAVSVGDYGIVVKFTEEQGDYIATGDRMELFLKGKKDKITVKVQGIPFSKDEQGNEQTEITAALPEGNYIPGSSMKAVISKSSELYEICVPIEAIREDALGSYVLITNPYNTPLGEELLTVRVAVEVLDKDNTAAAVNGTLTKEDPVIVSSSRKLEEGERVRLEANQ